MMNLHMTLCLCGVLLSMSCAAQVSVEIEKTSTLVEMFDNPISITHSSIPDSNIALIPSFGEINKKAPHKYNWRVLCGNENTATLYVVDTVRNDTLRKKTYKIIKVGCSPLLGAAQSTGNIRKNLFKAFGGISTVIRGWDIDAYYSTAGYYVTQIDKNGETEEFYNKGAKYTEPVRKLINKASKGDQYLFTKITYKKPGCTQTFTHPDSLLFTIE